MKFWTNIFTLLSVLFYLAILSGVAYALYTLGALLLTAIPGM